MLSEVYKIGDSYCLDLKGKSIIRKFSDENYWIDYVVIVPKQFEERAVYLINEAYDDFWETDCEAYGDLVEEYLEKAGIPFDVIYHDPDEEDLYSEYEESWENFIDSLNKNCV